MANTPETPLPAPERQVLKVSELNRAARGLLEGGFPLLWVEGEISNLARPGSGHLYFSLKDAAAQVRCALFRNRNLLLRFKPVDGMQVLVRARVSLYEPRGDFQLLVEHMEEAGGGALQRAFEELKRKLAAEGLFDAAYKRLLPAVPSSIGVVTSPSGAALHDILSVIRRRYPLARVILYPVPVQGEGAAAKIAAMLATASTRAECEVLILARGGGSLEDLAVFNTEDVARAIRATSMPVVSGVGHEIDLTIADFAADLRAPTPSGAAELVTPDSEAWRRELALHALRLQQLMQRMLEVLHDRADWCVLRLQQLHPGRVLRDRAQRLDELELRLGQSLRQSLRERRGALVVMAAGLREYSPARRVRAALDTLAQLGRRLDHAARDRLRLLDNRLMLAAHTLDAVSPLATLQRGYAIISDARDGSVIAHASDARPGQSIRARLADGSLLAEVRDTDTGTSK